MLSFSLLEAAWLPVRRRNGARSIIRPAEIASGMDDPIVAFAWGRADFDAASREFMIGLLATAFPPPPNSVRKWEALWASPPTAAQLDAAFAPFAAAFLLDGAGPRFGQDFGELEDTAETPVSGLLIEAAGANTIKENKDLFQKRGQIAFLSRPAAAMALFALQTFAPTGGAGHRTSMRGGGPLTTLAAPIEDDALWSLLWLNTPPEDENFAPAQEEQDRIFPWLAETFVSDGKPERLVAPSADRAPWTGHVLQAFWGAPRRIRLVFAKNAASMPCPITGRIDDVIVTGYRTRPWGASYDAAFRHPLSPYYRPKGKDPWLPVHPQPGGVPYRDWPDLAGPGDDESQPARMTALAQNRLRRGAMIDARLIACGYDMDNMKARGFVEAQMPLFVLAGEADGAARLQADAAARGLVSAADLSASAVAIAVRIALAGERADGKATPFAALRERFFQETENAFFETLRKLFANADTLGESAARRVFAEEWLKTLKGRAVTMFDEVVSFSDMPERIMERAAPARRNLTGVFLGHGALGKKLFTALELPPPDAGGKRDKKAGKGK